MSHSFLYLMMVPSYLLAAGATYYLFSRTPSKRRMEFYLGTMSLGAALHAWMSWRANTASDPETILGAAASLYMADCALILCYFHFMAIAIKRIPNALLRTIDGVLLGFFLLQAVWGSLLTDRIGDVPIRLGGHSGVIHFVRPSWVGQTGFLFVAGMALYFFFRLGSELWGSKRTTLRPLMVGVVGFGASVFNDMLVVSGLWRFPFLMSFGYAVLLMGMAVYLMNQMLDSRRRLADQKADLERLTQAQNEFFAVAGHELQTPITSLIGYSEMIQGGRLGEIPDNLKAPLNRIDLSVRRLQRLTSSILDVHSLQKNAISLHPRPLRVDRLMKEILSETEAFWTGLQQDVQMRIEGELPEMEADPARTRQILFNLLANASKQTPPGGSIRLRLIGSPTGIRIEVSDSSRGLTSEEMRQIFDPFYVVGGSQHHGASHPDDSCGLGLYIAKRLIEMQGGVIGVRSQQGQGTTFMVLFPAERLPSI